jgi:hypothetical protein
MTPTTRRPTAKQLRYLRSLAQRAGQTLTPPATATEASQTIQRLRAVSTTGFSFAELEAQRRGGERDEDIAYAPAPRSEEIDGYGSSARWTHRR